MYHTHFYSGMTSINDGHSHDYKGETSPAPTGVPHVHHIAGYTAYEDGHRHYYIIETSPAYQVPGGHIHYISGITYISEEHYHSISDTTSKYPY
ncbi:YmaF family protein [Clostridium fungisolvens]|uniref:YmaF family protein n=1 Tax=Clostridium fungisolvens TaxID=1604897 RepID=A0A6V8SKD5_9CLOT|nr:YmaF family protein [Clostridium fungisolvens]GFP75608.1 hypothetical protein bsdtw1_01695 [Clostridium fungisolvens]